MGWFRKKKEEEKPMKPLIPANHSLFDDDGREFYAVRHIYSGDIVRAEDFLYMNGDEFQKNSLLPLSLLKYVLGKRFN